MILVLECWGRIHHDLSVAGEATNYTQSKGQDAVQLLSLFFDDLFLKGNLIIGLVWLQFLFHLPHLSLHHHDFAAFLFDKLYKHLQMLPLKSVAFWESMAELGNPATCIK
jgi:hypothetical protein